MAQVVVLMAGLLLIAVSQASGVADRSTHHSNLAEQDPVAKVDDNAVLHPTRQVQDSMAFTAATGDTSISQKHMFFGLAFTL